MDRLSDAFDLGGTFVHLDEDGTATRLPVTERFWTDIDPRLERGRLVSRLRSEGDWRNWEMHPEGDELILVLSGHMTFIMEGPDGGLSRAELKTGEAIVIPKGAWHTADVPEPSDALYVTPGQGTRHREREGR